MQRVRYSAGVPVWCVKCVAAGGAPLRNAANQPASPKSLTIATSAVAAYHGKEMTTTTRACLMEAWPAWGPAAAPPAEPACPCAPGDLLFFGAINYLIQLLCCKSYGIAGCVGRTVVAKWLRRFLKDSSSTQPSSPTLLINVYMCIVKLAYAWYAMISSLLDFPGACHPGRPARTAARPLVPPQIQRIAPSRKGPTSIK